MIYNFYDLLVTIENLVSATTPVIVGLAVLIIIWGVFRLIAGAGDVEKRKEGQQFVLWGVIGVFVMLSIWGFVNILRNTLPVPNEPVDKVEVLPKT